MRSTIKILLGLSVFAGLIAFFVCTIIAIGIWIPGNQFTESIRNFAIQNNNNVDLVATLSIIFAILAVFALLTVIISNHAIAKMNSAIHRYQLVPSMVLILLFVNPLIACFMIFSPSRVLISKHPYFE